MTPTTISRIGRLANAIFNIVGGLAIGVILGRMILPSEPAAPAAPAEPGPACVDGQGCVNLVLYALIHTVEKLEELCVGDYALQQIEECHKDARAQSDDCWDFEERVLEAQAQCQYTYCDPVLTWCDPACCWEDSLIEDTEGEP